VLASLKESSHALNVAGWSMLAVSEIKKTVYILIHFRLWRMCEEGNGSKMGEVILMRSVRLIGSGALGLMIYRRM